MITIPLGIWVLFVYGLAAMSVHLSFVRFDRSEAYRRRTVHYVLITRNHAHQMEWYLRAIRWYADLRGMQLQVTIMDDGSEDETREIAECMRRSGELDISVIGFSRLRSMDMDSDPVKLTGEGENARFVDLRLPGEASKIPYVHVG
ncbi:hypothetical protein DCC85_20145 [Paenibacillus sp. CAA11]|uniref:hypothetical protein n=1 Tax=Paenibacillus sp. CAA11 TaxID=1532905 RepID=UPI000D3B8B09|nr:hypothetical protein [Paenibacillus sp. CAA11]AWB46244.1 hypothetical protein DCC85_20145 [Paenibacillus sp. CAA11]